MSGAFKALSLPGREATPTTRLTLVNHELNLVAHLSAMTVAHGDAGAPCRHDALSGHGSEPAGLAMVSRPELLHSRRCRDSFAIMILWC